MYVSSRFPAVIAASLLAVFATSVAISAPDDNRPVGSDAKTAAATKKAPSGTYSLPIPPKDFAPPKLVVEEAVYDWGAVVRGTVVTHTFQLHNKGGTPLIIQRVKPACGCTAVDEPKEAIPPGGSAPVTLKVDTTKFKGSIKKTAQVWSNTPSSPDVLTLQGDVDTVYKIEPERPQIEVVRGFPVQPYKLTLRRAVESAAKVTDVTTASTVLTPTLREVEAGQLYEVDLKVELSDNKRSYFWEDLVVKVATDGQEVEMPVKVQVRVKDRIDISPKSAYFAHKDTEKLKGADAQPITKTVDIKSLGGPDHTFKIAGLKNTNKAFQTKLITVEEGKHYQLQVTLPAAPSDGSKMIREQIILETDDDQQTELKVTAMAMFRVTPAKKR